MSKGKIEFELPKNIKEELNSDKYPSIYVTLGKEGNVYEFTTELEQILIKDIVKLQSKIKEVREYIDYYGTTPEQNDDQTLRYILKGILVILDKEKE